MKFLANSLGQTLKEHSNAVSMVSVYLMKKVTNDEKLIEASRLFGLLHDIGKATKSFQNNLSKESEENKKPYDGIFHHEISWKVATSLNLSQESLYAIYWHHAQPISKTFEFERNNINKIAISEEEKEAISEFLKEIDITWDKQEKEDIATPDFFEQSIDNKTTTKSDRRVLVRAVGVVADRVVSQLDKETVRKITNSEIKIEDIELLKKYTKELSIKEYKIPDFYDKTRSSMQEDFSKKSLENTTTQINAPAGFGKTLLGALFSIQSGKQTFWVCPRNQVASGVYEGIVKELKILGATNTSVELFLGGERKRGTDLSLEPFNSDIIVTNIDNVLKPSVNNMVADLMFKVLCSNVVFDEFHELATKTPMFAAFVQLMRIRHQIVKSKTMLLSATGGQLNFLWDNLNSKTCFLPKKGAHAPAAHDKLYNFSIVEGVSTETSNRRLTIFNTVKMAQLHHKQSNSTFLTHSRYTDEDKDQVMKQVLTSFDKEGCKENNNLSVSSAPILQAALDISFNELHVSLFSPEFFLQTLGRCNRWGQLESANVCLMDTREDRGEKAAISLMYNLELSGLFFDFLKSKNLKTFTLNEMYSFYNEFNELHKNKIQDYTIKQLECSQKTLSKYYKPQKAPVKQEKAASGKTLRSHTGNYFYVVKENDSWMDEIFSCDYFDFESLYKEESEEKSTQDIVRTFKTLVESGFVGFEKFKKTKNIDFYKMAKKEETPFPCSTKKYIKKYGIVDSDFT